MNVGFTPSFGGGSSLSQWRVLQNNLDRQIDAFRDNPVVQRDIAYVRENLADVKTPDDLLGDYRLYSFAMKAYGLESQIFARGLMDKVLSEPLEEPESTVNQLIDSKFREIAAGFRFNSEFGPPRTADPGFAEELIRRFTQNQFEAATEDANPAIRLALYFERKAPEITDVYEILADKALGRVARGIAGLSEQTVNMDIDAQAKLLEDRLNLEDFRDPDKLAKMIDTFLVRSDIANGPTGVNAAGAGGGVSTPGLAPITAGVGGGLLGPPPVQGISGQTLLAASTLPRF